jgi:hypothetical protein
VFLNILIEYGDLAEKSIIVTNIIGFDVNGVNVFERVHVGAIVQLNNQYVPFMQ